MNAPRPLRPVLRRAALLGFLLLLAVIHAADLALLGVLSVLGALRAPVVRAGWEQVLQGDLAGLGGVATVLTYALLHGGPFHLLNNALFLWLFGSFLTPVVGNRGLLAAFFATALTGGLACVVQYGESPIPVVGASGIVSGLGGLYLLLAFRWEDIPDAYTPPLSRPIDARQAALVAVILTGADFYVLSQGIQDGVAHGAHVGGFAGGALLGAVLTTLYPTFRAWQRSRFGPRVAIGERP